MRKIRFRAWDKRTKEMYDVIEMGWRDDFGMRIGFLKNPPWGSRPRTQEEVELMQYIGRHDKNGKEIYEGDRVKAWHPNGTLYYVGIIKWDNEQSTYFLNREELLSLPLYLYEYDEFEVIGNIYEKEY